MCIRDSLTMVRGIPKASKSGENMGNRGIGNQNINPDAQGTLEEIVAGMADYEYVMEILSTPVYICLLYTSLAAFNSTEAAYENDVALAEESRDIMQETLDEVIVTMPSNGKESDRETAITAMQTAIDHMEDYITKLRNGENVSDYADIFQNDFNSVTGLANLYNE